MGLITTNELGGFWDWLNPFDTARQNVEHERRAAAYRAAYMPVWKQDAHEAWVRREREAQARFARRRYRSLAHRRMQIAERIRQDTAELRRQSEARRRRSENLSRQAEWRRTLTALQAEINYQRQRAARARAATRPASAPSTGGARGGRLATTVSEDGASLTLDWPRRPPLAPAGIYMPPRPTTTAAAMPPPTTYAGAF